MKTAATGWSGCDRFKGRKKFGSAEVGQVEEARAGRDAHAATEPALLRRHAKRPDATVASGLLKI